MLRRAVAVGLAMSSLLGAACGGGPRAATADLATIRQPTPDPTLDAVVRDLPRALAGVMAPSPTPTRASAAPATPRPRAATLVPSPRPTPRPPTATPQARR